MQVQVNKKMVRVAAIFGMLAVILGAFGAHALKDKLTNNELEIWRTAFNYHFYHVFALLFLSILSQQANRYISFAFFSFIGGIVLFSGSLYLIAIRSITGMTTIIIGTLTPFGGLLFIAGWTNLILSTLKHNKKNVGME